MVQRNKKSGWEKRIRCVLADGSSDPDECKLNSVQFKFFPLWLVTEVCGWWWRGGGGVGEGGEWRGELEGENSGAKGPSRNFMESWRKKTRNEDSGGRNKTILSENCLSTGHEMLPRYFESKR